MKRRKRRGVSLGTITMLTVTCLVLAGFFALLPRLTGQEDVRVNASELAVAIDQSLSQISYLKNGAGVTVKPQNTPLPQQTVLQSTAEPTPTVAAELSFTLCAAGSIKTNSAVQKTLTDDSGYQFQLLFEPLSSSLTSDLTVATLEDNVIPSEKLSDSNLPAEALIAFQQAGIDVFSVGHPAALDSGINGLSATKQSIQAAGMFPYGLYVSQDERNEPPIELVNGIQVAFLSYQSELSSTGKKKTTAEEQAYAFADLDLSVIQSELQAVRQRGAQVVIVSLCWGKTSASEPTKAQRELAQSIADAGADIILGSHADTFLGVEMLTANRGDTRYHPVLCAYNMGNLFTYNRDKRTNLAGILLHMNVVYSPSTDSVAFDDLSYTPTYCWRGKENGVQRYRVLNSAATPPNYVEKDQASIMERCLKIIQDRMTGSVFVQQ
ncbi:MAG: CapA family protein [Eubacteriales bacterium]|nr:CapA family protein [Eubacteriales bacterium]